MFFEFDANDGRLHSFWFQVFDRTSMSLGHLTNLTMVRPTTICYFLSTDLMVLGLCRNPRLRVHFGFVAR